MQTAAATSKKSATPRTAIIPTLWLVAALIAWALVYPLLGQFASWYTYRVLSFPPAPGISDPVHQCCSNPELFAALTPAMKQGMLAAFLLYELPHVFLLLALVVFGMGIIRSFFTPERTRVLLAGRHAGWGTAGAAALGVVTPFCSCSAVPLFIGFVGAGVPLGVTLTFLATAPLVNEVALALLWDQFGWRVAALYLGTGLAIAVTAGWLIGRARMERFVEEWVFAMAAGDEGETVRPTWNDRLRAGLEALRDILGKVWPYVLAGVLVGGIIHAYVPRSALVALLGENHWWSVPLAVLLGVPMYSNAAGIMPVVQALIAKGVPLGTALALMMAVVGLSLPEFIMLRRVLKWPLIAAFAGIVAVGIGIVGVVMNAVGR